jgi:hypothetical protein
VRNCIRLIIFLIGILSSSGLVFGQTEQERINEIEAQKTSVKHRMITAQFDSAIYLSEQGAYDQADQKFRFVLKNLKSIPSDFTFYFGKNSFFLGKYKQSIDWLNKYIQLKGTTGQFSEAAVDWLSKAEAQLLLEHGNQSKVAAEVLSRDYDIDCGPLGKVQCPVCSGTTVVIKKGYINESYKTCPYCNRLGYLTCIEYNLLVRGQLKPSEN